MYKAYDFTFAGASASSYGLCLCDIGGRQHDDNSFGNVANIVETRIPNRITPLHYGVRYHDKPLEFTLIFGAREYMDRYQMQDVAKWLTGYQDYQWLCLEQPDLEHIQFRCLIKSLTPISIQWFPIAFEARVICDCPYGYSYPFEESISVNGSESYLFRNNSTVREHLLPDLKIALSSSCRSFSITNRDTGSAMQFSGLPAGGITILVDNENQVIREQYGRYDLYEYFNFRFFDLVSGDNQLTLNGTGTVTISGRYLYNVGA